MRKHFLILMLLTLLPLAGWAEEIFSPEKTVVAVSKIEYQQKIAPTIKVNHDGGTELKKDEEYDFVGFFEKNDGTGSAIALNKLQVGKTYYVKVTGKGVYSGAAYGKFTVQKAAVNVDIATVGYFTKPYKSAVNPAIAKKDISITLRSSKDEAKVDDILNVDEKALAAYTFTGEDKGKYDITFSGITLKDENNYELIIAKRQMEITAVSVTGGAFTFKTNYDKKTPYTYTATEQIPTFTIEWDHDGNDKTDVIPLVKGTDYDVVLNGDAKVKSINAGTYQVEIKGKGNFKDTQDANILDFEIVQAPLTVMTLPQEKIYDDKNFDLKTAKYNIAGRVGNDATVSVTGLVAECAGLAANKGAYSVTVNTGAAKIGDLALNANYDITVVPVDWTVNARPVTLTVPDVEMIKGKDLPAAPKLTAENVEAGYDAKTKDVKGETGAISEADQTAIAAAYKAALANGKGEALYGITKENIETKDYANAIKADLSGSVSANYAVTVVKGTLKVKGADFTIMPVVESDIEYGNSYTIGYYTAGATIDESKLIFIIDGKEYPYNKTQIANLPTARGSYPVTIKEGSAVGTGNNLDGKATLQSSAFSIIPRKLTLTVKNQTVHTEDPISIIDELTAGAKGYTLAEGQSLVGDDVLALTYKLDDKIVSVAGGKIKGYVAKNDKNTVDAIIVTVDAKSDVNANYNITIATGTAGKLDIDNKHVADLAAATATATITEGANNGSKYEVTISGRELTAETWNVLVLPFDVNPLEFCNAVGTYAVFNTLSKVEKDATDPLKDKIYFKLAMNTIPANQPFLVKPLAAVDFDSMNDNGTPKNATDDYKKIKFDNVIFKNAEPKQEIAGANFIGTYAESAPTTDDFWALQGGVFKHFSSAKTIKFTRAFIELTSGATAAEFFVEDIDNNGVTAIKSLSADQINGLAVMGQGWYTLNGIKLQSAPVVKGVYIHNGKKVVIK